MIRHRGSSPETIVIADHVLDLGPGAGTAGGTVCFEGTVEGLRASGTITGRHLDNRATLKKALRKPIGTLEIRGATEHNPRDVDVDIPLGVLVVITGVAGLVVSDQCVDSRHHIPVRITDGLQPSCPRATWPHDPRSLG